MKALPRVAGAVRTFAFGLAALALAGPAHAAPPPTACEAAPLGPREVYLRGSFNAWAADEAWRLRWACDRYEAVARPQGAHQFKLADEAWSRDADWGRATAAGAPTTTRGNVSTAPLQLAGPALEHRFDGRPHRFELHLRGPQPQLRMSPCPAQPPFGDTVLYLRGSMNNWGALEDYALRWHCDAYVLNLNLQGRLEFKIADAAWTPSRTLAAATPGAAPSLQSQGAQANLQLQFDGAHTLRLTFDAQGQARLLLGPKTFADPGEQALTDPVARSLRFDSRLDAFKRPFGAQPTGSTLHFNLQALPGVRQATLVVERRELTGNQEHLAYHPVARIPLQRQPADPSAADAREHWRASHRFEQAAIYGYWFDVETAQGRYAVQNNRDTVHWTREKGSMGPAHVEALPDTSPATLQRVRRYRQTIHLPDLRVPDWAADVVYYYVFPERFRNGNKANDPQAGRDRYQHHSVEVHARWLERPFKPGEGGDAVYNNDFFGGDLAGLIEKLDDIRALGANTLYLTPIFRAASNHKYDTGDYKQIDPAFGTAEDFRRLTQAAAQRGMRVILDTSLNHVGADSPYFDRFGNFADAQGHSQGAFFKGKPNPASPYFDWFLFDTAPTDPDKQYQGWVGVKDLPELNKDSASWRRFAYRDPDSVTRHWLREGAGGWRMDVVPWVNDGFWREWSAVVKATRPDALTVAETWFDASKYFLGDTFDSTMNYIFRNAVLDFAAGGHAGRAYANLELTREAYPAPMLHANMNLLSTHDQARALHHFGVPGDPHTDPGTDPARLREAKQRLLLALTFQVGFPGAPTVYYGDEVGVGGGDDPYNRATYPWPDAGGQPDTALRADFQALLKLRHDHAVLRRGRLGAPLKLSETLVAFPRQLGAQHALVLLSNAQEAQPVTLPVQALPRQWRDARTGEIFEARQAPSPDGGAPLFQLQLELPALTGRILLSVEPPNAP